jgi:hypothetical protein
MNLTGFFGLLYDWPAGTILIVLLGLLVIFSLKEIIDRAFLREIEGVGVIEKKIYKAPFSSLECNIVLRSHREVRHQAVWTLQISVNGKTDHIHVSKKYFNSKKKGQDVNVVYSIGRISKNLYLEYINE